MNEKFTKYPFWLSLFWVMNSIVDHPGKKLERKKVVTHSCLFYSLRFFKQKEGNY